MTKEDLIEGEYYRIDDEKYPGEVLIHKYERMDDPDRSYGYYLSTYVNSNQFAKSTPWLTRRTIKIATPEEKHWLNKCIEFNKFIPFEEAMETFKNEILIYESL